MKILCGIGIGDERTLSTLLLALTVLLLLTVPSQSASITFDAESFRSGTSACHLMLAGRIEQQDDAKIQGLLGDHYGGKGQPIIACLNSEGGNFETAIEISKIFRDLRVATRIPPDAKCLSACAITFLVGMSYATGLQTLARAMSASAQLGFHSPVLRMPPGQYDGAHVVEAYNAAIDSVGKRLLSITKYRPWSDPRPLMKPTLLNEMMMVRGENFFFIDTIRRAAEFDVEVLDAPVVQRIELDDAFDACENAVAAATDSESAQQVFTRYIADTEIAEQGGKFTFKNFKGRYCTVSNNWGGMAVTFDLGFGTFNVQLPLWAANPGAFPLRSLLHPAFKANRSEYLRKLVAPAWCSKPANPADRTVCASRRLSDWDRNVEARHRRLSAAGQNRNASVLANLSSARKSFTKARDACAANFACLLNAYNGMQSLLSEAESP